MIKKLPYNEYPDDNAYVKGWNACVDAHKALGEVVLTYTESDELVAVTRQDEDSRILKVLWQKE